MKTVPITCLRPTPERAAQFAAPPYDVFDDETGRAWVASHPNSFLEIDLPEATFAPGEEPGAEALRARARERLDERVADGTLVKDDTPCYYFYQLEQDGICQTGIVCACAVSDYLDGTIRRHESTRVEKLADRVAHIRALGAQTGPIFIAYEDSPKIDFCVETTVSTDPLYEYEEDGVVERVWRIDWMKNCLVLKREFEKVAHAYIADGHHRCAAAAEVAQASRKGHDPNEVLPSDYFLAILYPASQLHVHAYNRVVADRAGMSADELVRAVCAVGFEASPAAGPVVPAERRHVGMFADGRWWELVAPEPAGADPASSLDVSLLQSLVLEPVLGISDPTRDKRISFVSGLAGTDELMRLAGTEGVAFSMHPTSFSEMAAVADAGLLMPPKSTWFAPKPRSGLFVRRLQDDLGTE